MSRSSGSEPLRGHVAPPLLDGRLPRGPREIALSGGELREMHTGVGLVRARATRAMVALRVTGQIALSPEITDEQVKLGTGGVMTLAVRGALSRPRRRSTWTSSCCGTATRPRSPASSGSFPAWRRRRCRHRRSGLLGVNGLPLSWPAR